MPAADRFFVDTNVLLYSVDRTEPRKRDAARQWISLLWENGAGRLSWQVLHEFYANAERKARMNRASARKFVEVLSHWQPVESGLALLERGWHWMDHSQLSFWDSLIVAAAERTGCRWLLSEDFQDGQSFDGIRVVNPFAHAPHDFGLRARKPG